MNHMIKRTRARNEVNQNEHQKVNGADERGHKQETDTIGAVRCHEISFEALIGKASVSQRSRDALHEVITQSQTARRLEARKGQLLLTTINLGDAQAAIYVLATLDVKHLITL
ncbi:MAG: hypothetical protein HY019_03740 [Aquabacterium sp.]|uniref:hypothetical protein n=1 Tax=Aquabacterium sp. TaxID=1872578 RepID=UPI0025BDE34B|nr:hypothetical protein [Aquabacterium sp.]MBI3381097.1 hypothetical protein [Aquabacterium sp.]